MQLIELKNIPNQVFNTTINDAQYRIQIRTMQNLTFLSVWKNEVILFHNQLCVPNEFINPYNYISTDGKFYFRCLDDEYPTYKQFGNTQYLLFLSNDEVNLYAEA